MGNTLEKNINKYSNFELKDEFLKRIDRIIQKEIPVKNYGNPGVLGETGGGIYLHKKGAYQLTTYIGCFCEDVTCSIEFNHRKKNVNEHRPVSIEKIKKFAKHANSVEYADECGSVRHTPLGWDNFKKDTHSLNLEYGLKQSERAFMSEFISILKLFDNKLGKGENDKAFVLRM
jgi:hypothetical protein